jgi:hypothetical protein
MKKIPFTIKIGSSIFHGYLSNTDIEYPPKDFFVFIENRIVGELVCRDKWIFEEWWRYKTICRLTSDEGDYLADYLGNIAAEACEGAYHI